MTITAPAPEAVAVHTTSIPIADITLDLYRRRNLGKLRTLQQSINENGLLRPIPVTADGCLIAGERRLQACRNLGWDRVPVTIARNDAHAVELLADDHADAWPAARPRAASELVLLGLRVEEFEQAEARLRRAAGQQHQRLDNRRQSRDSAIAVTGLSQHYYSLIRPIALAAVGWEATDGSHVRTPVEPEWMFHAREVLDLIDRVHGGEEIFHTSPTGRRVRLTVNAVYDQWVTARRRRDSGVAEKTFDSKPDPTPPAISRKQREALTAALGNLSGLCHGLASISDIDPSITSGEAAAMHRDLSNAIRVLRTFNNKIKEHANGTA